MLNLIQHELKYYFKNKIELIYIYTYFISILVLMRLASSSSSINITDNATLAILGLWVALTTSSFSAAQRLFTRDHEQGLLEYYQLMPIALEGVVLAKWFAFLLFLLLPLVTSLPVAGLFFQLPSSQLLHIAGGIAVGALALSTLASLVAALTCGLEKAGALFALIGLPLAVPVLIFGSAYCRQAPGEPLTGLLLVLGFSCFLLPITCWVGASAIRHSH